MIIFLIAAAVAGLVASSEPITPNKGKSQKILGRQYDVGLPGNNYRPVHISSIESWIMKTLKE